MEEEAHALANSVADLRSGEMASQRCRWWRVGRRYIYARVLYITAVPSKPNHSRLPASSRTCNYVADTLASYECTLHGDSCYYMSHPPNFVLPLVLGDLPGTIVYWKFPSLSKKKSPWRERESRERKGNE
jgi:hypothetical protein